jgi:uncharacterized protein
VQRGIAALRAAHVPFSVLMVVDEPALVAGAVRVFEVFQDLGVKDYSLISVKPENQPDASAGTPTDHYTNPQLMNEFLAQVYDIWQLHGDPAIRIRELRSIESRLEGMPPGICTLAGGCLGKYFLVEPSGEIAHCDLFVGDRRYTLGNIHVDSWTAIRGSEHLRRLQDDNARALALMHKCPDFDICRGWCPHERYLSVRHNPGHTNECCGLRPLIAHIRSRMKESVVSV